MFIPATLPLVVRHESDEIKTNKSRKINTIFFLCSLLCDAIRLLWWVKDENHYFYRASRFTAPDFLGGERERERGGKLIFLLFMRFGCVTRQSWEKQLYTSIVNKAYTTLCNTCNSWTFVYTQQFHCEWNVYHSWVHVVERHSFLLSTALLYGLNWLQLAVYFCAPGIQRVIQNSIGSQIIRQI